MLYVGVIYFYLWMTRAVYKIVIFCLAHVKPENHIWGMTSRCKLCCPNIILLKIFSYYNTLLAWGWTILIL